MLIRARLLLFAVARRRSYHHALQTSTDVPYIYYVRADCDLAMGAGEKKAKIER